MKNITIDQLNSFQSDYLKDPVQRAVRRALYQAPLFQAASSQENEASMQHHFSIDIKTMDATSQGASGRCWIFAGMNVLREIVAKKLNLAQFELSQNYVAFYDKLEKINFFMESVIELKDRAWDERTLAWVLTTGIQDGGQWDMLCAVVKKYGVVPQSVFPDAYQARNTRDMNKLINRRLRRFASEVKAADSAEAIAALKETALKELYGFLCTCFGVPPQNFSFDVVDKDGKYIREDNLTPHSFYEKYVGVNLDDYVSIIHSPTVDKPYYQTFTVSYLGNVTDVPVTYLNLPLDEFKKCVISQLSDQEIVWFGSDCGNYIDRPHGVWDERSFDLSALFNIDFTIDKETSLYSWDSAMNHAMVLTGVNLIDGQSDKWKIENSWGKENGHNGYYVASDSWFDSYVYQAVVHKKYLGDKALEALNTEAKLLDPWDPMGTLAD